MARPKKNGTYLNVCIETPIYERLENFCKDAGHTKTVSLFSELFSLLVKYDKKYLLIGNQNAITYKEIFPYIKENKACFI